MERRKTPRTTVNLPSVVVIDDGLTRVDGVVRNVSASGAAVDVSESVQLPSAFYILMPENRLQPCTLVWRNAVRAGLKFD